MVHRHARVAATRPIVIGVDPHKGATPRPPGRRWSHCSGARPSWPPRSWAASAMSVASCRRATSHLTAFCKTLDRTVGVRLRSEGTARRQATR
jgi:hypothetical protein